MPQSDAFALENSGPNQFLFAQVGKEVNGSPLIILSVMARLGQDPWIEAESSRVLGLVRLRQARDAEATALLEDAGEAFLRLGDDAKLDDVLSRLSVLRSVPPSGQRPAPRRQAVETER